MSDVLVVGGGVIGCATALALAKEGAEVTVIERGTGGREPPGVTGAASWAAAGVLGAQIEKHGDGPLVRLMLLSRTRYPAFVAALSELTGRDVELRPAGVMQPAYDEASLAAIHDRTAWQERAGLRVERLDARAVAEHEPALTREIAGAVCFPDDLRIDPPSLSGALRVALARSGIHLRSGAGVARVTVSDGRARGVELTNGERVEGSVVVIAAGSWSSLVEGAALPAGSVQPARGQMVEVKLDAQPLRGVVDGPECYLSPRDDGRVLVGSTVELVGYRTGATARTVSALLAAAERLCPEIGEATVHHAWSGFRPFTIDELPLIGPTGTEGLFVATGHHRNGVLLAPITGEIVAALVAGRASSVDLSPFDPARLHAARA